MIASTHHNEEIKLLPILKKIFKEHENINLIIAPRHPERSEGLRSLFLKNDMISELESSRSIHTEKIIFIDSFGILSNYYEISDIVFLGGSLINSGGHNPIEPALKKCAILTGPNIFNWQNLFNDMIKNKSCIKIQNLNELDFNIRSLIKDKIKMKKMKKNGFDFAKKQFVDTQYLDKIIIKYMNSK
jgi:3-deoxy-D-manno-octulosonic-acid transferase